MLTRVIAVLAVIAGMAQAGPACTDDGVNAGRAVYDRICSECHYEDDFTGQTSPEIQARIVEVASGNVKHQVDLSQLSEQEQADVAAFFASFE